MSTASNKVSVDLEIDSGSGTVDCSHVNNEDFLIAIFGEDDGESLPFVCGVQGHPKTAKGWQAVPWVAKHTSTDFSEKNAYYSTGKFRPNAQGQWRRIEKLSDGLAVILLDDVGVKVTDIERLKGLPPSYVIETSPDNFQYGYILVEPLADKKVAQALVQAIIEAGLSDPGARGINRLARLPKGVNGKYSPPFQCRLVGWNPERRYSVEQVVSGLRIDLIFAKAVGDGRNPAPSPRGTEVHLPSLAENPVVSTLKTRNLYKKSLGNGKHDITCPWVAEHTNQDDGGTAYWEPNEAFPTGGFKCFHGHCVDRHIRDLIDYLDVPIAEARNMPVIRLVAGQISKIVSVAEFELAKTGKHYQRGGLIVSVFTDPGTEETSIRELNPQNLVLRLSEVAIWERINGRSWEVVDPPQRHSRILYDSASFATLPVLLGLSRQPYLRPDGSLMTVAGYDPLTRLFGVFNGDDFDVPQCPTRDDALVALNELKGLLTEFPFAESCDESAALSAILTASIRPALKLAPMFHVRAPQIASGKSYLCNLFVAFAGPVIPSAVAFPLDDEECRKLILATLLTGPSAIVFDNLTADLVPYKSLCSVLTEEFITGRILQVSRIATVGTRAMFLSSGNNVDPVRDMARRCLTIRLDPQCEVPAARKFDDDPLSKVRKDRGHYVSLALTIIRAWIVAGRPKSQAKPLASFEQFSELVRQPLLWLGLDDPATSLFETMATDPDRETLGRLMMMWHKFRGSKPTMVRDLVKLANKFGKDEDCLELHDLLLEIADSRGEVDRRRLGWWIKKHANRPVDGLKIERASGTRNADQWVVVSVVSVVSEKSDESDVTKVCEVTHENASSDSEKSSPNSLISAYVPPGATSSGCGKTAKGGQS